MEKIDFIFLLGHSSHQDHKVVSGIRKLGPFGCRWRSKPWPSSLPSCHALGPLFLPAVERHGRGEAGVFATCGEQPGASQHCDLDDGDVLSCHGKNLA